MNLPGKLVRDKIPAIIEQSGIVPRTSRVTIDTRLGYIKMKLLEEINEYMESGEVVELADVIEVCFAAAHFRGVSMSELLFIAYEKRLERGGFQDGIIWLGNENGT